MKKSKLLEALKDYKWDNGYNEYGMPVIRIYLTEEEYSSLMTKEEADEKE